MSVFLLRGMSFWPLVKRVVKDSDVILLILDARMPETSRNKKIERMARMHGKELFYVFNKIDLVPQKYLNELRERYRGAFFFSGVKNIGISKLKSGVMISAKRRGIGEPLVGIVGYPNVGKSAVINALCKRAKTKVSRVAGTTRGIQWVNSGSLRILDSPGVVPIDDKETKLGVMGAKNPERLKNIERIAMKIISGLLGRGKDALERHYKIKADGDEYEVLLLIGRKRGFLRKGGEVDERRTALTIIRDWQSGKLGV
jgi:ribosome biogenesis GTPase A